MIFLKESEKFNIKFEVASCFIEHKGEILLLRRTEHKPQGGTWGVPAGKIENNESPEETVLRELREETGIKLEPKTIKYFKTIFVRYPSYDFKYHMYSTSLDYKPKVALDSNSHNEFCWSKPNDALKFNLIPDEDSCIKMFFNIN